MAKKKNTPPKYPATPARNCQYCKYFNASIIACNAPNAHKIANFNYNPDKDCILFKYEITETPVVNEDEDFVNTYCKGTKCPFYYETENLCTKPSKCPYVGKKNGNYSEFHNVIFNKEIE